MTIQPFSDVGVVSDARGTRIVAVRPVFLSYTYPPEHVQGWSGGRLPGITAGLVEITTDTGVTGVGETYAGVFAPDVVRAIVEYHAAGLIGQDPSNIERLWHECRSRMLYWGRNGIAIATLSAIEAALWDVCGKLVGKPVVELLGGPCHDSLPRYASGGMEADAAGMRAEATSVRDAGYLAMKIRTGVSPEADRAKAQFMIDALGPDVRLAVDAVQGTNPNPWSATQAIAAGKALEDLGLLWYEEPCAAWDVDGYAACRAALDIPIAGGESCTSPEEVQAFLDRGAVDILQPDASWLGGLLPVVRAGAMAARAKVGVAVHAWGSAGTVLANYHAGFATPACGWLEFPSQPNPLISELMVEPLRVEQGRVLPPTAPGLGLRLTPELEAAYPYRADHRYHFEERR
ncbi:MAG: mandelate racemase/muconate lactonizing enzyme family protein [Chloroflexi bacterium]|nr:mandelate racemase/muconate lactonizing enzyme family protein [Chloroflexota bacterium]